MPRIKSTEMADLLSAYLLRHFAPPVIEKDLEQQMLDALLMGDYSLAIRKADDYRASLYQIQKIQIPRDGDLDIILFDTRGMVDLYKEPYADYLRIGVNYIRAALALCRIEKKSNPAIAKQLNNLILSYYHTLRESESLTEDVKEFNWYLIQLVSSHLKLDKDEVKKRLLRAKDYVNLEDPSYHYAVIGNDGTGKQKRTYFVADIGLYQLTNEQRQEIKERKNYYKFVENSKTSKKKQVLKKNWYNTRPWWIRKLIDNHVDYILNENHVIPTQLRKDFPGVRNGGLQVNGYCNNGQFHIELEIYHSGTVAHLGKNYRENLRVSALNRDQLNALTGGHGVSMLTLNDERNMFHEDRPVVKYTHKVMVGDDFDHTNLPPNPLRRVAPNIYDGINAQLSKVADCLNALIPNHNQNEGKATNCGNIIAFLKMERPKYRGNDIRAQDALNGLKDLKHELGKNHQLFYAAIICRKLIRKNLKLKDSENLNRQIATFTCIVNYLLKESHGENVSTIVLACLSGKDRTREILLNAVLFQKMYTLTETYPYESYPKLFESVKHKQIFKTLLKNLVANGFQQYLAGSERTSLGCTGLKSGMRKLPRSYPRQYAKPLHRITAGYNSSFPAERKNKSEFYKPKVPSIQSFLVALENKRKHLVERRSKAHKNLAMLFYSKGVSYSKIRCLDRAINRIRRGDVKTEQQAKKLAHELTQAMENTVKGSLYRKGETYDMAKEFYEDFVSKIARNARVR